MPPPSPPAARRRYLRFVTGVWLLALTVGAAGIHWPAARLGWWAAFTLLYVSAWRQWPADTHANVPLPLLVKVCLLPGAHRIVGPVAVTKAHRIRRLRGERAAGTWAWTQDGWR
jgi:hypothetical protein